MTKVKRIHLDFCWMKFFSAKHKNKFSNFVNFCQFLDAGSKKNKKIWFGPSPASSKRHPGLEGVTWDWKVKLIEGMRMRSAVIWDWQSQAAS